MKKLQRVILLQLERSPLFVQAIQWQVWRKSGFVTMFEILPEDHNRDFVYTALMSLLLQPLSTTASKFTTRYISGEVLRCRHKTGVGNWSDGRLLPGRTDQLAAHAFLLEIVRSNCKSDSQRCSSRKHGLDCSAACCTCREQSCTNSASPDLSENDEKNTPPEYATNG